MFWILLLVTAMGVAIGGRVVIKRRIAWGTERRGQIARGERCMCGYPLEQLDMARCPECGRVFSFDANPEQLGLTNEQLARIAEKRRAREANR